MLRGDYESEGGFKSEFEYQVKSNIEIVHNFLEKTRPWH